MNSPCACPAEPVELLVDPLRISQALSNLLTNAAKYTDAGGHIHLEVRCLPQHVEFSVRDSGIGLPPAQLPTIFEMFSQVDSAIDRSEGGLGIGLALVKGLVSLHGGRVEAAERGPRQGQHLHHAHSGRTLQDAAGSAGRGPRGEDRRTGRAGACWWWMTTSTPPPRWRWCCAATGTRCSPRTTARPALRAGEQEEPDAIILDIGMPEMNGYEVARRVRRTAWGNEVLLLALTGWGQKEDIERAHNAGLRRPPDQAGGPGPDRAVCWKSSWQNATSRQ